MPVTILKFQRLQGLLAICKGAINYTMDLLHTILYLRRAAENKRSN